MILALYRVLLRLYPDGYRRQFGDEMVEVFRAAQAEAKASNAYFYFCWRELAGLLRGALGENLQSLAGLDRLDLLPSRRFAMHSEFRFPRSTVVLMTIILAMVATAIEKATAIAMSLPHTNPPLPPIQPAHLLFLRPVIASLAGVYVLAALTWAVLFALRRSGQHRLSELGAQSLRG